MKLITRNLQRVLTGLPKPVLILVTAAFINFLGYMALPFLVLYMTRTIELSLQAAGLYLTIYGIGNILGTWIGGRLSDLIGARSILIMSLIGSGAALSVMPWLSSGGALLTVIAALALTNGSFRPAYNTCVLQVCPETERGRAYSLYLVAINIGAAIATSLGGLVFQIWPGFIFLVNAGAAFLSAVWLILMLPTFKTIHSLPLVQLEGKLQSPWADKIFLLTCAAVFLVEAIAKQPDSTLPVYMTNVHGMTPESFGQMLTVGYAMFAALAFPISTLVKRFDPRLVTGLGSLVIGIAFVLLGYTESGTLAVLAFAILIFGELLFYPALMGTVMAQASNGRSGSYMGLYHSAQALAGIVAPLTGTWIYSMAGSSALWLLCGFVGGGAAAFFIIWFLVSILPAVRNQRAI